jgi:hypothetical protein
MANIKISQLPNLSQLANTTQFPVANANVTYAVTSANVQSYMATYPGGTFTGANFSATSNVIAAGNVQAGNVRTTGLISATGNVTAGNISTGRAVITTANITTGNITTGNIANLNADAINLTGNLNLTGNFVGGTITGITDLAVADGGTGRSSLTSSAVLIGSGTSPVSFVSPGTGGNLLVSDGSNWVSQALATIGSFSIVYQGEITVNATNTFTVSNSKSTVLFVYFGNGAGGNQFLFSNIQWGMPVLNQQRIWYSSGVDFQVAQSGSLLAAFAAGSGTSVQILVNANNLGAYGSPGTARCLIYQL